MSGYGTSDEMLSFGYQRVPLGYQVHLDDFVRKSTPGQAEDSGFTSLVRLTNSATQIEEKHEISMKRPLTHGKCTLYQPSAQRLSHGVETSTLRAVHDPDLIQFHSAGDNLVETSTLRAVHDPGRLLRYLGCLTICAGIAIVF